MKLPKDDGSSDTKKENIPRWKPEKEVQLFYALGGRRPVGINRYFQMIFVQEEFNRLTGQEVTCDALWKYLDTLYDMDTLNDAEDVPFSLEPKDFVLPQEYQQMQQEKDPARGEEEEQQPENSTQSNKSPKKK